MISQKAKYALRALLELAKAGAAARPGDVSTLLISEIATSQNIPKKFLEQILLDLKHDGLVASRRGKQGGYVLLKNPEEITFLRVMRLIDGPLAPLPCLSRMAYRRCEDCTDEATCAIRKVFAKAHDATTEILDYATIADAMRGTEAGSLIG